MDQPAGAPRHIDAQMAYRLKVLAQMSRDRALEDLIAHLTSNPGGGVEAQHRWELEALAKLRSTNQAQQELALLDRLLTPNPTASPKPSASHSETSDAARD